MITKHRLLLLLPTSPGSVVTEDSNWSAQAHVLVSVGVAPITADG